MKVLMLVTCFVGLALGSVAPVHAVDPYVDTGFTTATPRPDADLVLVREKFYGAGGLDLSAYGIAGGPHDYVQSIYVRLYVDGNLE
ncbi:MAG: hypothetical protein HKN21_11470, partial [Candidatus Eisenbacteria bacterium]|nr:hypothetical protein [Candidatus Eisenbacteria bacterium]